MKRLITAIVAASLIGAPALAATSDAALAPGKPAGVNHADLAGPTLVIIGVLAGVGILVGVLVSKNTGQSGNVAVTTTTAP